MEIDEIRTASIELENVNFRASAWFKKAGFSSSKNV